MLKYLYIHIYVCIYIIYLFYQSIFLRAGTTSNLALYLAKSYLEYQFNFCYKGQYNLDLSKDFASGGR